MAYFLRENARDDFNAKRQGRAMHYHDTDKSPYIPDQREELKSETANAMQSYENPLHRPNYDRMVAYASENAASHHQGDRHDQHLQQRSATSFDMRRHNDNRFSDNPPPSKKMVGDDIVRRGNGNILAPKPLSWEESKPRIRGHQQLPDSYLLMCANHDDEKKSQQVDQMARCGQENFYKGFSNKPIKAVGTQKVPQAPVNSSGIGIWGFGGMGKMSEESTGGLRKNIPNTNHHLEPLESPLQLHMRLQNQNHNVSGGQQQQQQQPQKQQQQQQRGGQNYDNRPWAKPTDLQHQKLQNGFCDNNSSSNPPQQRTQQGSNINNNSAHTNYPIAAHHPTKDRNSSVLNECFQYTHDKTSNDPTLRQRANRYPDPATQPRQNVEFKSDRDTSKKPLNGGIQRMYTDISQGNLISSPPGAKLASRSDTTSGAAFSAPRSQSSFN